VGGFGRVYAELAMKPLAASKIAAGLLLPAMLSLGTARAAETRTWPELPDKIGNQGADYSVVTKTRENFRGRQLAFNPLRVFVAGPDSIVAQEQVAEIHIRHHESWKEVIVAPAAHMIASAPSMISPVGIWFLVPAGAGVTVVTAPFTLAIEGLRRLLPAKVIQLAP
jgi:hypothetical protein